MAIEDIIVGSSIRARGQINKKKVFYVVHGEQRVRAYAVPTDPQTPRQLSKRAFWRNGMEYWYAQPQSFRDDYKAKAKKYYPTMFGVNLFMRDWVREVYVMEIIKSIQRGSQSCSTGDNDVTITAVDMSKTVVDVKPFYVTKGSPPADVKWCSGGFLVNSTTLRIRAFKGANFSLCMVEWQVIEYF